jgi:hypothetical protein
MGAVYGACSLLNCVFPRQYIGLFPSRKGDGLGLQHPLVVPAAKLYC